VRERSEARNEWNGNALTERLNGRVGATRFSNRPPAARTGLTAPATKETTEC